MTETIDKALEIAGIGIVGVFVFMILFYLMILGLDKLFPYKEEITIEDSFMEEDYNEEGE
ncbi:MAG: OadG-related small transporter subunit [Petrimonas sp.]|nr:OadG-related small transporter subunit [Petrimonas sp.]